MWLLQACFVCRQAYCGLSLKYHLPITQERLERDYLGHYCEKSLKLCDWSSNQATLFDRKTWNSECQGMYRAKLTSYLDYIHWHSARHDLQYLWKFEEISRKVSLLIYFNSWVHNQIFHFFPNTNIHRFLYLLIKCL